MNRLTRKRVKKRWAVVLKNGIIVIECEKALLHQEATPFVLRSTLTKKT